ncbi:XRE-like HTH transcriptional regulator [Sulfitobacter phage pCB2047-C]|uniref:transcriptional repressor n=1 Tax=Sulfitobacter phage pCB2047-C TaxID=754043 RepID=UPI0002C113C7|nr:transcriptional repressor [Sulfitobacter phage pCB2047-C]YP_007675423.1 transcriptional repressor [Sulfitobacter phage pCB2047-A]AGG91220.1 XRE-like HTH transcriptional regulator [Sulfitobacter phage pCB2047-C]AGH30757.1 XRE-like HTH transcriptional regulator [Sulfitobacter phage pCB2047-A]
MFIRFYTPGMGLLIKQIRESQKLTQTQLAEKAGISRSQLSEIENERKPANTLRLSAIAKALGVTVTDLFDNAPDEEYKNLIVELMRDMSAPDRDALIHYAKAIANRA